MNRKIQHASQTKKCNNHANARDIEWVSTAMSKKINVFNRLLRFCRSGKPIRTDLMIVIWLDM